MSRQFLTIAAAACLSVAVLAFGASVAIPALKPAPTITLAQQAEWLQARAELAEAKNAVTVLEAKLSGIVATMQSTCPLVLKDGRPECAPPAKKK